MLAMSHQSRLEPPPSWFAAADSTQELLATAAQCWEDGQKSESYIQQALAQADAELDVLVGAYRYYFYKNNLVKALEVAKMVLDRLQEAEQWPNHWDALKPILLERLEDPIARLYLSAYGASGLVLARLGQVQDAQTIAERIQQIDAKEFGAERLLAILNPLPEED